MPGSNEKMIGEVIREFLRTHKLEDRVTETMIMTSWEKIMGRHIARYTTRMVLRGDKLTIYLDSAVLRNELGMAKTKIIQLIHKEIGKEFLTDISFR